MNRPPAKNENPAAPVPVPAMSYAPIPAKASTEKAPGKKRLSFWRRLGGGSLTVSLILHVAILALGAFWVLKIIPAEEEKVVDFMPTGGGGGDPASQDRSLQKQRASLMRPNLARDRALARHGKRGAARDHGPLARADGGSRTCADRGIAETHLTRRLVFGGAR